MVSDLGIPVCKPWAFVRKLVTSTVDMEEEDKQAVLTSKRHHASEQGKGW